MRLVSALVVRNEASRYLREVLAQCLAISDAVVVWDDASDDDTRAIAEEMGCIVGGTSEPRWTADEAAIRREVYEEAMRLSPDWLYVPDADELLERPEAIASLLAGPGPYTFEMWHAWGSRETFRVDGYWSGQYATRLFRPPSDAAWRAMPIHCGSAPACVLEQRQHRSGLRIFHYGYAKPEDALTKYTRYSMLDPQGKHSPQCHYDSMLTTPTLVRADGSPVIHEPVRVQDAPVFGVSERK